MAVATAMATAVASQAAQTLTDRATSALTAIARRIKAQFRDRPADLAVLDEAQAHPESPERINLLAEALRAAAVADPGFGREITGLWGQAQAEVAIAAGDGVVNSFHGNAGKVVQLRDVHGDLTIN
jgi:type II secretory pathway pseudopilin PulG